MTMSDVLACTGCAHGVTIVLNVVCHDCPHDGQMCHDVNCVGVQGCDHSVKMCHGVSMCPQRRSVTVSNVLACNGCTIFNVFHGMWHVTTAPMMSKCVTVSIVLVRMGLFTVSKCATVSQHAHSEDVSRFQMCWHAMGVQCVLGVSRHAIGVS